MTRQLPPSQKPIRIKDSQHQPQRQSMSCGGTIAILLLIAIFIGVVGLTGALLFPNEIRQALGVPAETPPISAEGGIDVPTLSAVASVSEAQATADFVATQNAITMANNANIGTQEAIKLAQTAEAVNATSTAVAAESTLVAQNYENATATAIAIANQPTPTATATPSPTPTATATRIPTMTPTPDPVLIFSEDFDDGVIDMRQIGQWVIQDGQPIAITDPQTDIFQTSAVLLYENPELDNFSLTFDVLDHWGKIIVAYKDDRNYMRIDYYYYGGVVMRTVKDNQVTLFPSSQMSGLPGWINTTIKVEIQGNNLKLYQNELLVYNYEQLPELLTGGVGFGIYNSGYLGQASIDNFQVVALD